MLETTCSVDGCEKPVKRLGWCYGHYMKQWRYGTPTPQHAVRYLDLIGQRFGLLTITSRIDGKWRALCDCGEMTTVRSGDLNRGSVSSCGDRWHRLLSDPGYSGAHGRVRSKRGPADQRMCRDCGRIAAHWSYDHTDPDELHTAEGYAYSGDPAHYSPRCVPCHKRFDLNHIDAHVGSRTW